MSWQAYADGLQTGKGKCQYAGIWGRNPASPWAQTNTTDLAPTADEITHVIKVIAANDQSVFQNGIKCGNKSFTCLRMENEVLICQGKGENKDHSLVFALSGQAIIIGFNNQPDVKTAVVREVVEFNRDYLKGQGC